MPARSSATRYGSVAITIHWLTAIAVFGMLASGLIASGMTDEAGKVTLLRGHAIMGVLIGVLTVLRIIWWWAIDRRPGDVAGISRLQARASRFVHYALYAVVLVLVSSGLATLVLTGANLQLFGGAPLPLPDFNLAPPFTVHGILARVLIALLIGHIGAALYHQFVRHDHLLARMGLGR